MAWRAVVISLSVRGVRDVAWISTFMLSPLFGLELFSPSAFFSLSNGVGRRPRPRPWDPAPRFAGRPLLICGSEVVSMYTIQGILVGIIVFVGGIGELRVGVTYQGYKLSLARVLQLFSGLPGQSGEAVCARYREWFGKL